MKNQSLAIGKSYNKGLPRILDYIIIANRMRKSFEKTIKGDTR